MLCVDHFPLRPVMACWLAAGMLLFPAAGNAADDGEIYYQFKIHNTVPELNAFHPQGTVTLDLSQIKSFPHNNDSGQIFRICSGMEFIKDTPLPQQAGNNKQGALWGFITPSPAPLDNWDVASEYVRLKLTLGTHYIMRIPLRISPAAIQSSGYKQVKLAVRPFNIFGSNCSWQGKPPILQEPRGEDNPEHVLTIKIPVPGLHDATPEIPDLSSQKTKIEVKQDNKNMTVTLPVSGASEGNTTVVWCDTDKPCDKEHQGEPMTRGEEIKNTDNVVTGAKYSVTLPIPTRLDYTASIRVTKQITWPKTATVTTEFPMVTEILNAPQAKLLNCTDRQCTFQWRAVLPYRDQDGSLGLNFTGGLKLFSGTLPTDIFTLQDDNWEDHGLELFAGQQKTSLSTANWRHYGEKNRAFLTSAPMPREGVFIVRFELKADKAKEK